MGDHSVLVGVVLLSTVVLFFGISAVVTRAAISVERSVDLAFESLGTALDAQMQGGIRTDLSTLKESLKAVHGYQQSANGNLESIDSLVRTFNARNDSESDSTSNALGPILKSQEEWQTYTRTEMEHVGTLLAELKNGFVQYKQDQANVKQDFVSAVNGVKRTVDHWKDTARADNNAAAMGSLSSDETMQHHAAIASIRPDLPMLLPTVRLLIGILSGPANIDRRNEVRQTWMQEYRKSLGLARQWSVWFLVSSPKNDEEAAQIREESAEYGDIMLMSYLTEDYHLIGAKVVEFFHAASLFPQLQFAMKGDDDTFVRVDRLLAQLDEHRDGNLFMGCSMGRMPPIRKERNKRYYVAPAEYSPDAFPKYCSGGGYVLSMDVVRGFDHVGQATGYEPFKFEDVNTGMLIDIAGLNVSPTPGKGFYCWGPKKDNTELEGLRKDWVVFHYVGLKKRWTMQKLIDAVHLEDHAVIFQKKLRVTTHDQRESWNVVEMEVYKETCDKRNSLAKAFGIGTLARRREDNLATTWLNTYFGASSNVEDAHLAFDGQLNTSWVSNAKVVNGKQEISQHSLSLEYGIHSIPFSEVGCLRVVQGGTPASALDVWFWDDDDAEWRMVYEAVPVKAGTSDTYILPNTAEDAAAL